LNFYSESLEMDEMIAVANVEFDLTTPPFRTSWGATVTRRSAVCGISASDTDVSHVSSVIERIARRVEGSNGGLFALSERCDSTVLSVAFYLDDSQRVPPGLTLEGSHVQMLVDLGVDVQMAVYRSHE
jgi:hypothetical protein